MKQILKFNWIIRKALIILMLSLCSIAMISCGEGKGSLKQKDGIDTNSINITVPGKDEITFNDTGKYTIYLQTKGNSNGEYYSLQNKIQDLNVKVYNKDIKINIQAPKGKSTMTIGADTYEGIFKFEINKPGTYTLESNLDSSKLKNVEIRIEKSNAILFSILNIFLIIALVFAVGVSIVAVVLFLILKKKKNKKYV